VGPATTLATDAVLFGITVSPDGKQIAYVSETPTGFQIVAIDPDGSNRRVIARRPLGRGFYFIEWSPLLDTLAAVVNGGDKGFGLVRVDLPSGSIQELSVSGWAEVGQPAWSPDGATIFAPALPTDGTIFQIWAFDARTGADRPITAGAKGYGMYTLSSIASGDLVGTTQNPATALWATDSSSHMRQIPSVDGEGRQSMIWVDGRIVTGNGLEMQVHDLDGTNPTRLKSYSNSYENLARCGTGRVVYTAVDDTHRIHLARTDILTGSTTRLADGQSDFYGTCTADGATLVFNHCTDNDLHCALTRKSLDSGQSVSIYKERDDEDLGGPLLLSPDGSKVLFATDRHPDPYEWLAWVPLTGGSLQRVRMPVTASEVTQYRWAPDGDRSSIPTRRTEWATSGLLRSTAKLPGS
jgi:Tol biopolymer transport system component